MQYYHPVKDNLLVFGSEPSCSSNNSDGSCSQISYGREIKQEDIGFQNYISNGFEENQKFILSYGNNGGDHQNLNQWTEKPNGYFGETPLDYDLVEDVKQLISSSSNGNGCNNDNNNFLLDENKTQEKVMYYDY